MALSEWTLAGKIPACSAPGPEATIHLVDEYRLLLMPSLHGAGHSVFKQAHAPIALKLEDVKRMDTGAVRLTYLRAPRTDA